MQQGMDWIEHIADKVCEHYKGRKVVLWGKYTVSDDIKEKLEKKYQIETVFYVDNDNMKIDNTQVFSTDYLKGKSAECYVVVPLAVYTSIRELLIESGYRPELDYYYFSDCIIRQEEDYYEDAHGNKIIGRYAGMKFAFSGFDSVIEIGSNVKFREVSCYVHSNSRIQIGDDVKLIETSCYVYNDSQIVIKNDSQVLKVGVRMESFVNAVFSCGVHLTDCNVRILDKAKCEIGAHCKLKNLCLAIGKNAEVLIKEEVEHNAWIGRPSLWSLLDDSKLEIGCKGRLKYGILHMEEKTRLKIGKKFSIQGGYLFSVGKETAVIIGDEGMFSTDIALQSNDGHSIFDVITGENTNSTYIMRKNRKIVIGNHVWVGMKSTILYNTRIADGSIIGAMSLVKGEFPNNCIVAGVPARIIKRNIAWCKENGCENILECGQDYIHLTEERKHEEDN